MTLLRKSTLILTSATLLVAGSGCATKRFVRASVTPLDNRLGQVEKSSSQNSADIDQLEKQVSRAEELASGAEKQANTATEMARQADEHAGAANQRADSAYNIAEQGLTKASAAEKSIDRLYDNLDNYQLLKSDAVTFAFDKSELDADNKAKLDSFVDTFKNEKRYVVEVQGFTDPAGNAAYNLELSRRRATTVVRYLTTAHQIPLRRIQMLGVGSDQPVADNKTREGRKLNRRVEIKVFALPENKAETQVTSNGTAPTKTFDE